MRTETASETLPKAAEPYIVRSGDGASLLVAGQVIRVLADTEQTNGAFGAVVCEATLDRQAIPLHWHEREHDTWFCTRGRLQVWKGDESRVLTPGDFAYVQPRDVHSYQSVAPRTQFFGIVAPGGWEGFFSAAGQEWLSPGLPPENHPFDFSRMGPAMGRYGVMRAAEASYAPASNGDATDRTLPAGPSSYILQSGYGLRRCLLGHISTQVLSNAITLGKLDMRTIEAGRGAKMPAISHDETHVFLYLLDGAVTLTINGETHELYAGDAANIPAGAAYATDVVSGSARWILSSSNGNGQEFWDKAGSETAEYTYQPSQPEAGWADALGAVDGVDVKISQ
jgi:quercetin 2,3-dioxygenase